MQNKAAAAVIPGEVRPRDTADTVSRVLKNTLLRRRSELKKAREGFFQHPVRHRVRPVVRSISRAQAIACSLLLLCIGGPAWGGEHPIHHALKVELHPREHRFQVDDTISLPPSAGHSIQFTLHAGLNPRADHATLETVPDPAPSDSAVPMQRYRLTLDQGVNRFTLHYGGVIDHPLEQVPSEERQFEVTAGLIDQEGVFLDSTSDWFPIVAGAMVTFSMDVSLPGGWDAVSQGKRTRYKKESGGTTVRWACDKPQDDIYLVAAQFTEYHRDAGDVQLQVFLRTPDAQLARRYLAAADRYIGRYQTLLGAYPYGKFALVENFWQSGYGMPSFTLLGSQIIRFPFIIYTSYPHEILHNWWGNGVYVDYREGNWSEGLTAYLSDHLVKVQQHQGAAYRRELLQKYADFVSGAKDFPLSEFTARESQASEAVGYGKALMFFHMLHRRLGDEAFVKALRLFYKDNVYKAADYDDLQRAFESVAHEDLTPIFRQWVRRTGAPALAAAAATASRNGGDWQVKFTLDQTQAEPAYRLRVPVAVTLQGRSNAYQTTVSMNSKHREVVLSVPARPLRVDVDPEFDVFRRLSRDEIPPALSGLFGAQSLLIVLPAQAPPPLLHAYQGLAEAWRDNPAFNVQVAMDDQMKTLPRDRAVWLFGWENRFKSQAQQALAGYQSVAVDKGGSLRIDQQTFPAPGYSLVLAAEQSNDGHAPLGWLMTTRPDALAGLGRKLPHYTKYSYLVFQGDAPDNIDRGMWPVLHSPLSLSLDGARQSVPMAALTPRRALIQLIDTGH